MLNFVQYQHMTIKKALFGNCTFSESDIKSLIQQGIEIKKAPEYMGEEKLIQELQNLEQIVGSKFTQKDDEGLYSVAESNEDVSTVQALLGHVHPETTLSCSHAIRPKLINTKSPLDAILDK